MLYEDIQVEIKSAMLAKDSLKRDCLRSILAEIKNENLINKKDITDALCVDVCKKAAKKRNDSIADFKKAARQDLVEKEEAELKIISAWLPQMKSTDETKAILEKIIADNSIPHDKKSMGLVMKHLKDMQDVDKKVASGILATLLA